MKKTEKQERFTTERKGYSKSEVELFLAEEGERNESIHKEQRERIDMLVEENKTLKKA